VQLDLGRAAQVGHKEGLVLDAALILDEIPMPLIQLLLDRGRDGCCLRTGRTHHRLGRTDTVLDLPRSVRAIAVVVPRILVFLQCRDGRPLAFAFSPTDRAPIRRARASASAKGCT